MLEGQFDHGIRAYSDERQVHYSATRRLFLGGIVTTDKGRSRLLRGLAEVRREYSLLREMKWEKVSVAYIDAYEAWVDVFRADPFARFSMLEINTSSTEWASFRSRNRESSLASAFHQFLLVTFGRLSDSKRWSIYPDAGLFSRDKVLKQVEFRFNRTYKKAFGPKSSRVIRLSNSCDSARSDLIQLADVLLGAVTCNVLGQRPESAARAQLVRYCEQTLPFEASVTQRGIPRFSVFRWVVPEDFDYRQHGAKV